MRFFHHLERLARDPRAVAAVEFAIVAPVFLMATMGVFDLGYQSYSRSVLEGVVEKAGRDATLEGHASNPTALDNFVKEQVQETWSDAELTFKRKSYSGFSDISSPERFTDANGNNAYDPGECFRDSNGNGTWDADSGNDGNGGADNVVVYTVDMKLKRVFPLWSLLGQPQNTTITAKTVLRNQPFADGAGPQTKCG